MVPAEKALRGRLEKLTPATSAADINFMVLRLVSSVICGTPLEHTRLWTIATAVSDLNGSARPKTADVPDAHQIVCMQTITREN
jgi:hypothetical protein